MVGALLATAFACNPLARKLLHAVILRAHAVISSHAVITSRTGEYRQESANIKFGAGKFVPRFPHL